MRKSRGRRRTTGDMIYAGLDDGGDSPVSADVEENWMSIRRDFLEAADSRNSRPAWFLKFHTAIRATDASAETLISDKGTLGEALAEDFPIAKKRGYGRV